MSQSLLAVPTPHFGTQFDGHMNAKPSALRKEDHDCLNLNREKSVAHVDAAAAVAEYDQKEDVKADIESGNQGQQQEKGQGLLTKKSSAPAKAEIHNENDVKEAIKDDDEAEAEAEAAAEVELQVRLQRINEGRAKKGRKLLTKKIFYDSSSHCAPDCPHCKHPPGARSWNPPVHLLSQKQEKVDACMNPVARIPPPKYRHLI